MAADIYDRPKLSLLQERPFGNRCAGTAQTVASTAFSPWGNPTGK
jgi:hypothetical protein